MAKKKKRVSPVSREEIGQSAERQKKEPAKRRTFSGGEAAYRRKSAQREAFRRRNRAASYSDKAAPPKSPAEEWMEERRRLRRSSDPKIRRQEQAKREKRREKQIRFSSASRHRNRVKNRRRSLWLFRILTWIIILAAGYFGATIFFQIDTVKIQGDTRYSQEELLDTLDVSKGDNLFFVDRDAASQRLLKAYPYLSEVQLKRKLPNTLLVKLTESKAAAAAQTSGGYFLLDKNGKILDEVPQGEAESYTKLFGLDTQDLQIGDNLTEKGDERTKQLFELLSLLEEKEMIEKTTFIDVEKVTAIQLSYDGRFLVDLGTMEDIDRKIRFLQTIAQERLSPSDTGLIDISETEQARFRPLNTLTEDELARMRNFDGSIRGSEASGQEETTQEGE